jgi:hypothetical protein
MQIVRSIGAVFAGLITVVVLSEGTDFVLRWAGILPSLEAGVAAVTDTMLAGALAYRTLAGVIGAFVAAVLAPNRPMAHALALGLIGLFLSTVGTIVMWGIGPAWYPIALAVVAVPASWLGGRIAERRAQRVQA